MKKTSLILVAALLLMLLPACGKTNEPALADGTYTAKFDTDSTMFAVNETCDGRGTLTVENGEMTIHVTLRSTHIVNLFPGTAEDAQKDGAVLLQPTEDKVTYSDGLSETVYGFDVPVPALDQEFDLALIGTKGVWYDHKVSVSDPQPVEETASSVVLTVPCALLNSPPQVVHSQYASLPLSLQVACLAPCATRVCTNLSIFAPSAIFVLQPRQYVSPV